MLLRQHVLRLTAHSCRPFGASMSPCSIQTSRHAMNCSAGGASSCRQHGAKGPCSQALAPSRKPQQLLLGSCAELMRSAHSMQRRGFRLMPPVCMGRRSAKIAGRKVHPCCIPHASQISISAATTLLRMALFWCYKVLLKPGWCQLLLAPRSLLISHSAELIMNSSLWIMGLSGLGMCPQGSTAACA